ncbi:hypothetical protein NMG60_11005339 [Bertholletia excelsa]
MGTVVRHHNQSGFSPPPPAKWFNATAGHPRHKTNLFHLTFYWSKHAEFLFPGWPDSSSTMYVLSLVFVFVLAILVEWLSNCTLFKHGANRVSAGLVQMVTHAVRVGLSYMVMLAVMSYNGGVFLAALLGHAVGFAIFGSWPLKKESGRR